MTFSYILDGTLAYRFGFVVLVENLCFAHCLFLTLNVQFGSVNKPHVHRLYTVLNFEIPYCIFILVSRHLNNIDGSRHTEPFLMLVLLIDQQYGSGYLRENKEQIFSGTRLKTKPIPLWVTLDSGILIITIYSPTRKKATVGLQNALKTNKERIYCEGMDVL